MYKQVIAAGFVCVAGAARLWATPNQSLNQGPSLQATTQPTPQNRSDNNEEHNNTTGPGRGGVANIGDESDADFLKDTAKTMGEPVPAAQIDTQILNWFGLRPRLESAGFTLSGTWTLDYSKPTQGGLDTRDDATRNLLDVRINVDTKALAHIEGGQFSIDFQNQAGRNGTGVVGDLQGFDNIDADGRSQIAELWYQQKLFDDRLRIKIGKVDANTEFAFPDYGGGFINSSIGHSPTITGLPTYPDGAMSVNAFVYPKRWAYVGAGAYDGSGINGVHTGEYGPSKIFHSNDSVFLIGEMGARWLLKDQTLPGHFGIGAHYHTGEFDTFEGGQQTGAAGMYLTLEQKLWHQNFYNKTDPNGLYALFQYAHANGHVSAVHDYFGAGITFTGPYLKTVPDSLGIGVEAAHLSDAYGAGFSSDFETDVEAYYNFQVKPYLALKPDVQYILSPGGDKTVKDAIVATLRVTLTF